MKASRQQTTTLAQYYSERLEATKTRVLKCLRCGRAGNRSTFWHVEDGDLCDDCLTKYMNGLRRFR